MRAVIVMGCAGIALAGCANPDGYQPMQMSPPLGYTSPAYARPSSTAPAYVPLPPAPSPSPADADLPPVVFQPNPPPTATPDPALAEPSTPLLASPDTSTVQTPAPAPVAAAPVATPATPDKGGDVPLMGFRPMKGQKAPTTSTAP